MHSPFRGMGPDELTLYNDLYERYQREVMPPDVDADFSDSIHFIICAAATGIVGNVAYGALKIALKRMSDRAAGRRDCRRLLDRVVPRHEYENRRRQLHPQSRLRVELEELLEQLELRRSCFDPDSDGDD